MLRGCNWQECGVLNAAEPGCTHVGCKRNSSQQYLSFLSSESESRDPLPMLEARMRWPRIAAHTRYDYSAILPTVFKRVFCGRSEDVRIPLKRPIGRKEGTLFVNRESIADSRLGKQ
jgi:hypothetical protein